MEFKVSKAKVKSSIEKFSDTLPENEKIFLSDYLQKPKYESLSNTFDELLKAVC
jgi:hypothetical protein